MTASAWRHGVSAYRNGLCRCDVCRAASSARALVERSARAERLAADPTLAPHGSASTYRNWRCRCAPCTAAHTAQCTRTKARAGVA